LKERLVGAAVLVAIGAWLIPWVLDGPERVTAPQSTALELPAPTAENPPARTETIVLDRRDSPVSREPATAEDADEDTTPSEPAAAAAAPARPAVAEPPVSREEPPAQSPAEPAATAAAPTPAETSGDAAAGETRWYVQLGAFGDRDNADRLAARVGTYGYRAHVSEFPSTGRTVYRVRVGPEPSRARAESIASALSVHSFVAQVVFE
jgi:cell division septation protein DedD